MKESKNHPELREGEVFLGNLSSSEYQNMRWKTKRQGAVPYNIHGKREYNTVPGFELLPVFAKRQELEKAGIPLEE